jgi:hypothetical protein
VVGCLVRIPHTSSLAELLVRGVRATRQVVSWVAGPGIEGGQVAVLRLHVASAGHATRVAYTCERGVYVRYGTKTRQSTKKAPNFRELRLGEVRPSPAQMANTAEAGKQESRAAH